MANSMALIEQDYENPIIKWSNKIVCTKRDDGSFSLQLVVTSDYGVSQESSCTGIRSPEAFIDGLMSVADWSELRFNESDDALVAEMCFRLHALDPAFADAVIDYVSMTEAI